MKPLANIPRSTWIYTLMVFLVAGYAMLRVLNLSESVQRVKSTADTTSYVRISNERIFSSEFLAAARPFVFPLLLKLSGGDPEKVVWAQGLFSILSWGILAGAVAHSLHYSFLKFAGFVLVLLLSLYRYIIGWDSVLLTESLSLSLMALFIAGWLWLLQGWRWQKAFLVLSMGVFWMFCRDTNAWVVLMIAVFILILAVLRQIDKRYLYLSTAFMILFFLSNLSADSGGRWIFPFQNVLGRRILPDARAIAFFASCGMPVSSELTELTGEFASGLDRAFYNDPALEDYRAWLHRSGKGCYIKWLLSDPLESINRPIAEFNTLVSLQNVQSFLFSRRFLPILPTRLESLIYPPQQPWILFLAACGIILAAVFSRAWAHNKTWWVAILLILLVFPHYFIVWHGDVMGIYRHMVSVSIQFHLGLWTLALLIADRVLSLKVVKEHRVGQLLLRGESH
jgi:hypothetical protein